MKPLTLSLKQVEIGMILVILRVDDDSRRREVVGDCNPCQRLAEEQPKITKRRAGLLLGGVALG